MSSNPPNSIKKRAQSKKDSVRGILRQTRDWADVGRDFMDDLYPLGNVMAPVGEVLRKVDAVIDTATAVVGTVGRVMDMVDRVSDTLETVVSSPGGNPSLEVGDIDSGDSESGGLPTQDLPGGPAFSTVPPITLSKIDTTATVLQQNKLLQIYTIHPVDTFLLQSVNGTGGISSLFEYELLIISERQEVPFDDLIGTQVLVRIQLPDGTYRPLHGIVKSMTAEEKSRGKYAAYKITIVPKLYFSRLNATHQIFLDRTLPEIVDEVLRDQGLIPDQDYEWNLSRKLNEYRITEQTTQYNETYFNFVSRLLEKEGIYYYFEHNLDPAAPSHKIIFVDMMDQVPICPTLPWVKAGQKRGQRDVVQEKGTVPWFRVEQTVGIQAYKHRDWNFSIPNRFFGEFGIEPSSYEPWIAKTKWRERDIYTYPGEYMIHQDGGATQVWADHYARIRYEEALCRNSTQAMGVGNCTGIQTGYKVLICSSDPGDQETGDQKIYNKEYLILAARENATVGIAYQAGRYVDGRKEAFYEVQFTAIPADLPFRPPQTTPIPRIYGLQTAIVVPETERPGTPNSEIFTDEYQRIKVKFHWDLRPKFDDRSSCWLRVATPLSGMQWGTVFIPRVGMEVLVGFGDGNPDKPFIVGSLYNESHRPPYDLPQHKTRSTVKTHSTLDGNSENFNELRFEDKKGQEQVFLNAERDLDINIEEDFREHTHRQKNVLTCGEHRELIKGKFSQTISSNKDVVIEGNHSINVGGQLSVKALAIHLEADTGITLRVGGSTISIWPHLIEIEGGPIVKINMGAGQVGLIAAAPAVPEVADNGQFGGPHPSSNCSTPVGNDLSSASLNTSGSTETAQVIQDLIQIQPGSSSSQPGSGNSPSQSGNGSSPSVSLNLSNDEIKKEIQTIQGEIKEIQAKLQASTITNFAKNELETQKAKLEKILRKYQTTLKARITNTK